MLSSTLGLLAIAAAVPVCLAQSFCTGPQYNDLPGFPASKSGCYPLAYYQTSHLGVTSPSNATNRCQQQCTSMSQCQSVVAQVNKTAGSNKYSGTCFFYTQANTPTGPRRCADTADLLLGYYKDSTIACFSASRSAASAYCSSYLSIPVVTVSKTVTPPVVTASTTVTTRPVAVISATVTPTSKVSSMSITTVSTVTSTSTSTVTATATVTVNMRRAKRATVPPPACITSNTPATRLSAACSCLSVSTSTTTSTTTQVPVTITKTATSTIPSTSTASITGTGATVTITTATTTTTTTTVTMTATPAAPTCAANACGGATNGCACSGVYPTGSTCFQVGGANCQQDCNSSADCPAGQACADAKGCGGYNRCAIVCPNPGQRRLLRFAREAMPQTPAFSPDRWPLLVTKPKTSGS